MRPAMIRRLTPLAVIATITTTCSGSAQDVKEAPDAVSQRRLRAVATDAVAAAGRGEHAFALQMLREVRELAGSARDRADLDFRIGWVLTRQSEAVPLDDPQHLQLLAEAADAYESILAAFPRQPQTVVNLALVLERVGDFDRAAAVLGAAARPDDAPTDVLLALGDLQRARGEVAKAHATWRRVVGRDWAQRAAHERIVAAARELATTDPRAVLAYAKELSARGMGDLGARAAADVVAVAHATAADVAEAALVEWALARVGEDRLDADALTELPGTGEWDNRALRGLHALVAGDGAPDDGAALLGTDAARRHIAASILLRRAELEIAHGEVRRALRLAKQAMRLAPPLPTGDHAGGPPADQTPALAAAAAVVARCTLRFPDAAPAELLTDVTAALPLAQLTAWAGSDPARAQASMQTLGMALADLGDPEVARGYLSGALATEPARAAKLRTAPRALPHLHASIGDTFTRQGRDVEAAEARVEAARGFLLDGDAERAQQQLQRVAPRLRDDARIAPRVREVAQFVEVERALTGATPADGLVRLRTLLGPRATTPPRWAQQVLGRHAAALELRALDAGDGDTARELQSLGDRMRPDVAPALRERLDRARARGRIR